MNWVDLWRIDLRTDPGKAALRGLVGEYIERAVRYRFPADRRRFLASRGWLLSLLAAYRALPIEQIDVGIKGKPFVAGGPSFNMSRRGDMMLVAVTHNRQVGVDIEETVPLRDVNALIAGCCTPTEAAMLHTLEEGARATGFYRVWTRKEALLKGFGTGLSIPPNTVEVTAPWEPPVLMAAPSPWAEEDWRLWDLEPGAGHIGALACIGECTPRFFAIDRSGDPNGDWQMVPPDAITPGAFTRTSDSGT